MIHVHKLTKDYGGFRAINEIELLIEEGTVFGFIGPNGAGKTTTMRIMATLLEPSEGDVYVWERSVIDEPERVRRMIGYMPDYYGVYDDVTVREYLEFFAGAYSLPRHDRKRILEDVMALTDLVKLETKVINGLSKGMKQRLALGKTLLHDPKFLILDEPAAGLDPQARIELRALLRELSDMGKTICISSHILTELSDICDSVGIIEKGQILAQGSVESLYKTMKSARTVTVKLAGRTDEAATALRGIATVSELELVEDNTLQFTYAGAEDQLYKVIKPLVDRELPIVGFSEAKKDLEALYMSITQGEVQ